MRKIVWLFNGLLFLVMMQTAMAAKRLGPPIEQLQSEPERIRIVIAQAGEKAEPNQIKFSVSGRLTGEAPDQVLLRTDEQTFADVVSGNSYIVAWTYMRRNRGVIGGWEEDPDGPSTVTVLGLGSTTLFEDTPEMRFLLTPVDEAESSDPGKQLDALLAQMLREDYRSRGLVITELLLREDLTEIMSESQAEVLKAVFQTPTLDPQHRDFLLRTASRLPQDLTAPWLGEEARRTIIQHGTQYDLRSFVPSLVLTAAETLAQSGEPADVPLLDILLYSNNPGVSKAALATMTHLDPEAARSLAEQAMKRGWIHSETRHAIDRYLRQAM